MSRRRKVGPATDYKPEQSEHLVEGPGCNSGGQTPHFRSKKKENLEFSPENNHSGKATTSSTASRYASRAASGSHSLEALTITNNGTAGKKPCDKRDATVPGRYGSSGGESPGGTSPITQPAHGGLDNDLETQDLVPPAAVSSPDKGQKINENKRAATKHEADIAHLFGVNRIPGSGSLGIPGDVKTEELLISCKRTELRTYPLKLADLEEISRQAKEAGRIPAMAIRSEAVAPDVERDWLMLPVWFVEQLRER